MLSQGEMSILAVPTFCIITGGNGGLGGKTAILLAQKVGPGSTICLVDRDSMEETARAVKEKAGQGVQIRCVKADLSSEVGLGKANHSIFDGVEASKYESAVIVHNVMDGDMSRYARDVNDLKLLQRCSMVNISGPIVMTAEFFRVFAAPGMKAPVRKTIVNVTSDSAKTPVKTSHIYSAGKAARDQFFRIMALEEPDVRILTYSPGAMDTEGFKKSMARSVDDALRAQAEYIKHWPGFLKPEQSAGALVKTLEEDNYKSAEVVRCYDVLGIAA